MVTVLSSRLNRAIHARHHPAGAPGACFGIIDPLYHLREM